MRVFALAFAPIVCTLAARYDWSPVDRVLTRAIENGTFPGCSAAVTTPNGDVVLLKGFGSYVYAGQKTPGNMRHNFAHRQRTTSRFLADDM